jgi:hypothetical protein
MRPWLEEVHGAHGSRLDVAMIDADEPGGADLAQYFGVIAIPSQVYIDRQGRVVELHAGIDTLEGLSKRSAALLEGRRPH